MEIVKLPSHGAGVTELENEEAEDAIEVLLHELDYWQDMQGGGEVPLGAGN